MAVGGRYLFTGGFDEIIRIYDVVKRKEVGQLDAHTGSILKSGSKYIITGWFNFAE